MKFSIRDLFLVTMIVALTVGWVVERGTLAYRNSSLEKENAELAWRTNTLIKALDDVGWKATFDDDYGLNVEEKPKHESWTLGGPFRGNSRGYNRPKH